MLKISATVVLQELRTVAIYDNTKTVKIFFIVLDVVAGVAYVVFVKMQPTKSARKILFYFITLTSSILISNDRVLI